MFATGIGSVDYDFHPAAESEYAEAARGYDEISRELGDRFVAEIESAIRRVCKNPEWFRKLTPRVRRCVIRTFSFGLLFEVDGNRIFIVAVMHLHRHPDYWKWRLTEGGEP